jgi:tellurite resistance protein TerC
LTLIATMLAVDLLAHRRAHVIALREAAAWSVLWVAFGVAFGGVLWRMYGSAPAQEYFAGYLIEKSLAVDNVFVWAIIFAYFAVPREYQHRVLFLGVLGALVFRGVFIAAGSVIIASFSWVLYGFAAFLLWTGYRMIRQRNEHLDPEASRALRWFRRHVPMTDAYHGQRLLIRRGGALLATPLLAYSSWSRSPTSSSPSTPSRRYSPSPTSRSWSSPRTPSRSSAFGRCTSCSPT